MTPERKWHQDFKWDFFMLVMVLLLPFSFAIHLLFDTGDLKAISIFGRQWSHRFNNNSAFVWFVSVYWFPLFLFSLWYINCRYKWRYAILLVLSPLAFWAMDVFFPTDSNTVPCVLFMCFYTTVLVLWDLKGNRRKQKTAKLTIQWGNLDAHFTARGKEVQLIFPQKAKGVKGQLKQYWWQKTLLGQKLALKYVPISKTLGKHGDALVVLMLVLSLFLYFLVKG